MLDFNERMTNIEALLSSIMIEVNTAATDGTIDTTDDELGAVIDEIFGDLEDIKKRYLVLKKHVTMVDQIINPATRK